jgi:hypothetical protein
MTASTSLFELLLNLLRDPSALTAYREDPEGFLSDCGDVSPADIREALLLVQDSQEADFGRDHNTGGNHIQIPPPPPAPEPEPGESHHEAAVRYLDSYVTNNYIDDRDTTVDNSVNQQIDTGGGDFDQDIDVDSTVASGDDSVAAGDDLEDSENDSGDDEDEDDDERDDEGDKDGDSVTGDDNESVQGDDNTTSFGDGDTTSTEIDGDVNVGDGGAFAAGGDASVDNSDSSTNDSFNDNSDNSTEDSFNTSSETTDNSDHSTTGSFNDDSSHSESAYSSDDDSYSDTSATTVDSHDSTQESYDAVV